MNETLQSELLLSWPALGGGMCCVVDPAIPCDLCGELHALLVHRDGRTRCVDCDHKYSTTEVSEVAEVEGIQEQTAGTPSLGRPASVRGLKPKISASPASSAVNSSEGR